MPVDGGLGDAGSPRDVVDADAKYAELKDVISNLIQPPTTMPWGNRSLLFRDPDGNLVNFFTPMTPQAIAKFRGR